MEIFEKIVSDSKDANNNIYNITIRFLKQVEENCTTLIQLIRKVEATNLIQFAFICGIINGFIEFVCGVLDVVILVITLLFKANLENNAEFKLDYLQLKEAIEELIEAWLKDPDFLDKEIQQFITTYTDVRYKNPKLTPYQIAHNTGEDLILTLDIVLSFVAIIKALTSSSKLLPKFTKWIDDVVENGGKGAKKLEDIDFLAKWEKAIESKGGLGFLDGQKLNRERIRFWIDEINKISNEKAVLKIADESTELFARLRGNRAGFNPFNQELIFQKGMTEYEMLHEFKHLEEFSIIGKEKYIKGMKDLGYSLEQDLIRTYKREMYVHKEIMKQANKFNKTELKHAKWIIDDILEKGDKAGIDLRKIKI